MSEIRLVALDLDGTLLNGKGKVTAANQKAIIRAREQGVMVILATGKTRRSALKIIEQLHLDTPGVFTQGLVIANGDGSIRSQQLLDSLVAQTVGRLAHRHGIEVLAYSGMKVVAAAESALTRLLVERYHEPPPTIVGPMAPWLATGEVNKLLLGHFSDPFPASLREMFDQSLGQVANVTQAVSNFLEILPLGSSKGAGLASLLLDLEIDPANVMAVGDGENDIEMLQLAGVGVAMGNAHRRLRVVADFSVGSNENDGVAEAFSRFVGVEA